LLNVVRQLDSITDARLTRPQTLIRAGHNWPDTNAGAVAHACMHMPGHASHKNSGRATLDGENRHSCTMYEHGRGSLRLNHRPFLMKEVVAGLTYPSPFLSNLDRKAWGLNMPWQGSTGPQALAKPGAQYVWALITPRHILHGHNAMLHLASLALQTRICFPNHHPRCHCIASCSIR